MVLTLTFSEIVALSPMYEQLAHSQKSKSESFQTLGLNTTSIATFLASCSRKPHWKINSEEDKLLSQVPDAASSFIRSYIC